MSLLTRGLFTCAAICLAAGVANAIAIRHVYHDARSFDPRQDESVGIRFALSHPGRVLVRIFDGRDVAVRTLGPVDGVVGENELRWDGSDDLGRPVPPEAYHYTIEAEAGAARTEWDLTDAPEGRILRARNPTWDAEAMVLRYRLPDPARVRVRIGVGGGGPLLRTLIDWVPRDRGLQEQAWDGLDASGAISFADFDMLRFDVAFFALPPNTILVGPPPDAVALVDDLPEPRAERAPKRARKPRMHDYRAQPIESRGDFPASLTLPSDLSRASDGTPIVREPLPLRLMVAADDAEALVNERFEASFFVDGRPAFETEVGFFPLTWTWDPATVEPGEHVITANLRGYDGHFGLTSIKIRVER